MESLQGEVESIVFRNEENGYSVLRVLDEEQKTTRTIVGIIPSIKKGEKALFYGDWSHHKKFGRQFQINSLEIIPPTTIEGIAKLLRSGFIKYVGASLADRIISVFGEKTLEVLEHEPERLSEVKGVGKKTLKKIRSSWDEQRHIRNLMLFLQEYDVTVNLASKIYRKYRGESQMKLQENPYILVDDIWGVGFKKADAIAQKLGFDHNSYKRIHAGLHYTLQEAAGKGHCYLPESELIKSAQQALEVEESLIVHSLSYACEQKRVIKEEYRVYLPLYYHAEVAVGAHLHNRALKVRNNISSPIAEKFDQWIEQYCTKTGFTPDGKQVQACRYGIAYPITILTGGPGTGKTSTLQMLVSYFLHQSLHVSLAAPTGRAAQRMGTVAGMNASTIHRLLEYRPKKGGGGFSFNRNMEHPIEADVVVIDEVSMVDILIMRALLEALRPSTKLFLVGDRNQLPSVGPGNVLADLLDSGSIPHVALTTIFRQAAKSTIVINAHDIIHDQIPLFQNSREDDCFFIKEQDPEKTCDTIVDLVCKRLPGKYGFDPIADIQVLTPMHNGVLGTKNLNRQIQKHLIMNGTSVERGEVTFYVGDRVMQIRNNYDYDVFNGDIGLVRSIDPEEGITVNFDGKIITYKLSEIDEMVHAYCISIHKSQGCEFKAVVIPVSTQHYIMLQRNLLYTALTRARKLCVFIGSPRALDMAVRNNEIQHRYSNLHRRIAPA